MDDKRFAEILEKVITTMRSTLVEKAKQYSRGGDRLGNFKKAAQRRNCTPEAALRGISVKHEVAIDDFIDDIASGDLMSIVQWEEKLIDSINYNVLLLALVTERFER